MGNLKLNKINKMFDSNSVVKDFSIKVREKSLLTILGPSGCGKSTLLSCIAGIEKPNSGNITLDDRILFDVNLKINIMPEKRNIGFVFQNYALWPHMNVKEHLFFPLKAKKMSKNQMIEKSDKILGLLNLEDKLNSYPYQLSGGEQQRVALGRALIMEPDLLLLDEPLSNLDALLRDRMQYEIKLVQKKLGITTIMVTHDQREAEKMSDEVIVMNNGYIEQYGLFTDIVNNPKTDFVKNFIRK